MKLFFSRIHEWFFRHFWNCDCWSLKNSSPSMMTLEAIQIIHVISLALFRPLSQPRMTFFSLKFSNQHAINYIITWKETFIRVWSTSQLLSKALQKEIESTWYFAELSLPLEFYVLFEWSPYIDFNDGDFVRKFSIYIGKNFTSFVSFFSFQTFRPPRIFVHRLRQTGVNFTNLFSRQLFQKS